MSRPKKSVPSYSLHRPTGQAVVKITLPGGGRKTIYLGRYDTPQSKAEYARVVASLQSVGGVNSIASSGNSRDSNSDMSMNELMLSFMVYAKSHYRQPDGTPTSELNNYKVTLRPLKELFGNLHAQNFGPRELKTVRDHMIELRWCRSQINARVNRIRHVVKWGVSESLIPVECYQRLATVQGLQRGRTAARESEPVLPVSNEHVLATLPHLSPVHRGMVEVQLLTGMRPGEVCLLRPADIDTTGSIWLYRPTGHKTAYRGKERIIAIGPKAQAILLQFTPPNSTDYYFSPQRAVAQFRAERAASRKTPLYPSQTKRNAAKRVVSPKRQPSVKYAVTGYGHAVGKACERGGVPHWHPNQLRHSHGTTIRQLYGLEAAQVVLGHSRADVTQVYAERDLGLALKVAAECG